MVKSSKKRGGDRCEICGAKGRLNSHHLFSRNRYSVRFDLANGICLCPRCHFSAHQSSLEFSRKVLNLRCIRWYKDLEKKAKKLAKEIPAEIEKDLEEITRTLEVDNDRTDTELL